jgi:uncharacterized protein
MSRTIWLMLMLLNATALRANENAAQPPDDASKVQFSWILKIPMRDGVSLNAMLYTPKDQKVPAPCIFTLTPYIAQSSHQRGIFFAAHGFPFLAVDVRGRGNSEGSFRPFIQEAYDGYDVVEWLARQPYCNGKISMYGGSYSGYDQWATASELPPHLATIVPVSSVYPPVDFPMSGNVWFPSVMQWLLLTSGHTSQQAIYGDTAFSSANYRAWFESGRPFKDLDVMLGFPSPIFHEWIAHPHPDAYWDSYTPSAVQYARLSIPILTITGDYDSAQPGALSYYRQYMRNASPDALARHYLVIGPWDHAGTRTPSMQFGGLRFGPKSLLDIPKLHLEWYAWTMQGGAKPEFLKKPVAYYVTHADQWRYADSLESITGETRPLYLDSKGPANDVLASGSLETNAPAGGPDRYIYDPRDVSTANLESALDPDSLVDQSMTYALTGKQLVYHSAPFEKNIEISGFFKLAAWIGIDTPDTDFAVNISEIRLDGTAIPLSGDTMRARYRVDLRGPQLIRTKAPLLYHFERFTFVSREITKGSRLRLTISPINSIYSEKNYNSGGEVAAESRQDARAVTVTLYHDRAHPSVLYVPLGVPQSSGEPTAPASAFKVSPASP